MLSPNIDTLFLKTSSPPFVAYIVGGQNLCWLLVTTGWLLVTTGWHIGHSSQKSPFKQWLTEQFSETLHHSEVNKIPILGHYHHHYTWLIKHFKLWFMTINNINQNTKNRTNIFIFIKLYQNLFIIYLSGRKITATSFINMSILLCYNMETLSSHYNSDESYCIEW